MKTAWMVRDDKLDWPEDIDQLIQTANEAQSALGDIESQLRVYASSGGKIADTFNSQVTLLDEKLKTINELGRKLGDRLSNRYWTAFIRKFLGGSRLTQEEFYILSALGMPRITPRSMGLSIHDEYDFFDMFCYEDDHQRCYINPDTMDTRFSKGFGVYPENLDISGLRPEQHDFFKANFPEIYARFKREPVSNTDQT